MTSIQGYIHLTEREETYSDVTGTHAVLQGPFQLRTDILTVTSIMRTQLVPTAMVFFSCPVGQMTVLTLRMLSSQRSLPLAQGPPWPYCVCRALWWTRLGPSPCDLQRGEQYNSQWVKVFDYCSSPRSICICFFHLFKTKSSVIVNHSVYYEETVLCSLWDLPGNLLSPRIWKGALIFFLCIQFY